MTSGSQGIIPQGEIIMMYNPREEGQGLVEYALILVLVAVVVIVVLAILGPLVANVFQSINSTLGSAVS
jgi:pilus assembly protein Flp/PilA